MRVADLFHSLPVRKRDLEDNHGTLHLSSQWLHFYFSFFLVSLILTSACGIIVREYAKLLTTAQSYAIICSQTSFSVAHKPKDKKYAHQ